MSRPTEIPIRGSWEALLQEGQHLAHNFNDGAIPIFEKIVTRLGKMPRAQRQAANQRLQKIYVQAATNLQTYLTMRERYDEALALLTSIEAEVKSDDGGQWEIYAAQILLLAGRNDEALARLHELAGRPDCDLGELAELATVLLRLDRQDEANAVLARMDAWVAAHHQGETDARRRDEGVVASLRAALALREHDWENAVQWLDTAVRLDPQYASRGILMAIEAIRSGEFDRADALLARVKSGSVRVAFWQAYSLWKQGETARAAAMWRRIAEAGLDDDGDTLTEYILAHYYLGDKEGEGLSTALQVLSERTLLHWGIYFLAGLGWALRGNVASARADMGNAMLRCRASAEGRLLPFSTWHFMRDLVDDTTRAKLAGYFETSQ